MPSMPCLFMARTRASTAMALMAEQMAYLGSRKVGQEPTKFEIYRL